MPNTYSVSEAAKYLGISTKTLRRWEANGKLSPKRTRGGHRRYRQTDLRLFLETQTRIKKSPNVIRPDKSLVIAKTKVRLSIAPAAFVTVAIVFLLLLPQTIFGRMIASKLISDLKSSQLTQVAREILKEEGRSVETDLVLGEQSRDASLPSSLILYPSSLNLLKNPSFESVHGQDPAFWQYHPYSTQDNTSQSNHTQKSGAYSLLVTTDGGVIQESTKTEAGRNYGLGVWIKTQLLESERPRSRRPSALSLHLALGPGWDKSYRLDGSEGLEGQEGWRYYSTTFESPPPGLVPRIYVTNSQPGVSVFLDDAYFAEVQFLANGSNQTNGTNGSYESYGTNESYGRNQLASISAFFLLPSSFSSLAPTGGGVLSVSPQGIIYPTDASQTTGGLGTDSSRFGKIWGGNEDLAGSLSVNEKVDIAGKLTANGNVTLGNNSADDIEVGGRFISDLLPKQDKGINLGSSSLRWNSASIQNVSITGTLTVGTGTVTITNTGITAGSSASLSSGQLNIISAGTLQLDTSTNNTDILLRTGSGNINISTGTLTMTGLLDVRDSTGTLALAVDSTGNVGIGTTSPTSPLYIVSTSDNASVGSELVTNGNFTGNATGWTLGDGGGTPDWYYNSNNVSHADSGGTAVLQPSTALSVTTGASYLVTYSVSSYSAGSVTASIGGASGKALSYNATSFSQVIVAANTNNLKFTPTTTFVGTIDSVSVKLVTTAPANSTFANNGGTSSPIEIRPGGDNILNTFVGYKVGEHTTTSGDSNSALGYQALRFNTSGYSNTALGTYALQNTTVGDSNTAVGESALKNNTIGSSNNAIGVSALTQNTTGNYNNAIGTSALYSNLTGSDNTAIGYTALFRNQTGSYNTVVGENAGYGVLNNSFSNNSLFGYRAGYGLSTGSNNILLGYQTGDNLTTGANNIVIGYDIDAPAATSANTLNIGNLIFGTGLDGSGTTVSAGNIGIASTTPAGILDVYGSAASVAFRIGGSTLSTSNLGITSTTADFQAMVADSFFVNAGDLTLTASEDSVYPLILRSAQGGIQLSTQSSDNGNLTLYSAGTLTLDSSGNNAMTQILTGSGNFNISAGASTQAYSGQVSFRSSNNSLAAIVIRATNGGLQLSTNGSANGNMNLLSSGTLALDTSINNTNIQLSAGTGNIQLSSTQLYLTGNLVVTGTETFNGIIYTFPGADGASSSVLTTNGSGSLSWGTLGASSITADSLDFSEFKDELTLDADTSINGDQSLIVRAGLGSIQNSTSGSNDLQLAAEDKIILGAASFDLLTSSGGIDMISGSYVDLSSKGTLTLDTSQNNSNILLKTGSGNINVSTGTLTMTGILDVRDSTGTLSLATDSNGNVGIGTTAPGAKLGFAAATTAAGGIDFGGDVTLYRSGANILTTDDILESLSDLRIGNVAEFLRNFSGAQRFLISYANDANVPVLYVDANGQITMNSQSTQALRFNYDKGTGGIIMGNGASGEVARFASDGNVGIGTTSPLYTLDVSGGTRVIGDAGVLFRAGRSSIDLSSGTTSTTADLELAAADRIDLFASSLSLSTSSLSAGELKLQSKGSLILDTSATNAPIVMLGGNVGIGITNPAYGLAVKSSGNYAFFGSTTDENGAITFSGSSTLSVIQGRTSADTAYQNLAFQTNVNGHSIVIDTSGKVGIGGTNAATAPTLYANASEVGIGTISPGGVLDVIGNSSVLMRAGQAAVQVSGSATSTTADIQLAAADKINLFATKLTLSTSSTTAGSLTLQSKGSLILDTSGGSGDVIVTKLNTLGYVCSTATGVLSSGATCATSDAQLKQEVRPLSADMDVLASLDKLRGVSFIWDQANPVNAGQSTERQVGMIAQEVETVMPALVEIGADGYRRLDYAKMTSYLVEVAKAQQQQISAIQAEEGSDLAERSDPSALTQEILTLNDRIAALESAEASSSARVASLENLVAMLTLDESHETHETNETNLTNVLGDAVIGGDLTIGLIAVDDLDASINSMGEALKIQNKIPAEIDFLAGKVVITKAGDVKITGKLTAETIEVNQIKAGSGVRGINVPVAAGAQELIVKFETPKSSDVYAVTVTANWATQAWVAAKLTDGFLIKFSNPAPETGTVDWIVIE